MSRTKLVNGERIVFRHIMNFKDGKSVWLPVIRPQIKDGCKHQGEYEPKNGGYVCLEPGCYQFFSSPRIKKDVQTEKTFSDIN